MLPDTRLGEAALVAERMRAFIAKEAVQLGDSDAGVTCSFGVSTLPNDESSVDQLVEAVGRELAQSKDGGKNRVFTGGVSTESASLRELLEGEGLRAVQQPIVDLVEKRIVAYELLSRGPRGRYESPAVFLNLVHPGEALARLDIACLRECARAARQLPSDACLHFNLYPSTLLAVGAERVLAELDRAGADRRFCVELNEREVQGDSPELLANVRKLKQAGVQIAVDDVGFGGSCLEALISLEPDVIKVDRAYVCSESPRALDRLLGVANVLQARVIAEGVEDEETLERLRDRRVRFAQGYALGYPQPVGLERPALLWPQPRRGGSEVNAPLGKR